jgi:hypothetical protein
VWETKQNKSASFTLNPPSLSCAFGHQNDGSQPIETIICPVLVDHFLLLYLDKSLATLAPGSIAESKRRMTEKPHVYIWKKCNKTLFHSTSHLYIYNVYIYMFKKKRKYNTCSNQPIPGQNQLSTLSSDSSST